MSTASDRTESRRVERTADASSSEESDAEEDEIATISDVFSDMLSANEDLLLAAADYQLDNDVPSILAYQRILHRNLVEMADFVDSIFGVYNRSTHDETVEEIDDDDAAVSKDAEDTLVDREESFDVDSHDEVNGHTSEEATESTVQKREPERMRSLLIDRFRLENRRRMEQRSARLWRKMRRKVKVEESVGVAMTQAAERIAQMAASAVAAHSSALELTSQHAPSNSPASSTMQQVGEAAMSTDSTLSQPSSEAEQTSEKAPSNVEESAGQSTSTTPQLNSIQLTPSVPPLHPALPQNLSLALPKPPINPGGAMIMPANAGNFSKIPLPPIGSSGLNMLYPIGPPTLFPPNHMSSVCADCVPLHLSAHECRSVLKHITPPPPSAQPVMFSGQTMWPMLNGVIASIAPPQPARSVQPLRQPSPALSSSFKKMCEDCKKHHKSVHYCRRTLGHTAPEWLSGTDSESKPRKRRPRRRKGADSTVTSPAINTSEDTSRATAEDPPMGINEV